MLIVAAKAANAKSTREARQQQATAYVNQAKSSKWRREHTGQLYYPYSIVQSQAIYERRTIPDIKVISLMVDDLQTS